MFHKCKKFLYFVLFTTLVLIIFLVYSTINYDGVINVARGISKTVRHLDHQNPMSVYYLGPETPVLTASFYEGGHRNFSPSICPENGVNLKLLILVNSATEHQRERLAIRLTWGHFKIRKDISVAFFVGRSRSEEVEKKLYEEDSLYSDLIRGYSIDTYYNLTLKTISLLEWVDRHCSNASFILKTDDDMFINVPRLLKFIDENSSQRRTIFGNLNGRRTPYRDKTSKYYVSRAQYRKNRFPKFAYGRAYLMCSDIIHDVYVKSLGQYYVKTEDVFITGIVAELLNITRIHVSKFSDVTGIPSICNVQSRISMALKNSSDLFRTWEKLFEKSRECSKLDIFEMIHMARI